MGAVSVLGEKDFARSRSKNGMRDRALCKAVRVVRVGCPHDLSGHAAAPILCDDNNMSDQVQQSWDGGFDDAKAGRPAASASRLMRAGIDELSYLSGFLAGVARPRKAASSSGLAGDSERPIRPHRGTAGSAGGAG
jgi:hypothetical protein